MNKEISTPVDAYILEGDRDAVGGGDTRCNKHVM